MAEGDSSKRQVAFKTRIADILQNRYVKEDGWLPNYVEVGDLKVSRVNLLGVIVSRDSQESDVVSQNFILDDGSGRVALRFFEPAGPVDVGDIVRVIGRPREFGSDRYVVPEVMRKVSDSRWVEVRKLELAALERARKPIVADSSSSGGAAGGDRYVHVENGDFAGGSGSDDSNPMSDILDIIRNLDEGDGVGFDEISSKAGGSDVEGLIGRLLEHGDIFEIRPGRYKVLE